MATKKGASKGVSKLPKLSARIDRLVDYEGTSVKAIASVNIGDAFAIRGLKVMESEKGLFVNMPSSKYEKDGQTRYSEIFHAITKEARDAINGTVLDAYEQRIHMDEDQTAGEVMEEESAGMEQTM